tara:strand:+ start:3666 stop:4043 length:378 start_codon:yes stop_codon:yes gene_type:complete
VSPEEKAFSVAVDNYETLLQSETQAIVSVELDKLENIIQEKDQVLASVVEARAKLLVDPRDIPELGVTLDRILKIQTRNSQTLTNLIAQNPQDKGDSTTEETSRIRKIRTAYSSQFQSEGKRFKV